MDKTPCARIKEPKRQSIQNSAPMHGKGRNSQAFKPLFFQIFFFLTFLIFLAFVFVPISVFVRHSILSPALSPAQISLLSTKLFLRVFYSSLFILIRLYMTYLNLWKSQE